MNKKSTRYLKSESKLFGLIWLWREAVGDKAEKVGWAML